MVCVPLSPPASTVAMRPQLTTFPPSAPNDLPTGSAQRMAIGCEPRDVALARLRARLLRMIVDNERVRHDLCIRPR